MSEPRTPRASEAANTSLTLLQRARANEAGAWDRLVSLYTPLVRYWCARAGLQDADADDAAQEVFLLAAKGLIDFRRDRPGDTFRGWLQTIARNALVDQLRRRARQPVGTGGSDAQIKLRELSDPKVELPEEDAPEQVEALYRSALDLVRGEFEERTWQMFWQTVVEGRPSAAVAEEFGVTTAAIRKARSRVLHRIKQEIGDAPES